MPIINVSHICLTIPILQFRLLQLVLLTMTDFTGADITVSLEVAGVPTVEANAIALVRLSNFGKYWSTRYFGLMVLLI